MKAKMLKKIVDGMRNNLLWIKYSKKPYRQFYQRLMQREATKDPKVAVGGMWDEVGKLQFNFLINLGLKPQHKLLDFGCGSLRGGLFFIDYLNIGNYTGVDISKELLASGKCFLAETGLTHKNPILINNQDFSLRELQENIFDFVISFSVFTHMPVQDLKECLKNIIQLLNPTSLFYATIFESKRYRQSMDKTAFYYPFDLIERIGRQCGLNIKRVMGFIHPRAQSMLEITRKL